MGFGNQVSGQIGKTGNSISSWFGKANGAGDNASGGNGTGGGNNAGGENKGDENSGSQLQAPTVSVTGMDVVGERVTAKVSNLPAGATQVSYQSQIPSLGEGDYASIVFDNELSDIPQGNITYRWFKCAGLGSGAGLVAKELGSSPSLSLSGLQGSYINCEVTLTVNGKSKTFVPKAICNGKVSDGIYVRPRIG